MTQNLMNKSLNMGCGLVISHSVWAKVFVCVRVYVCACATAYVRTWKCECFAMCRRREPTEVHQLLRNFLSCWHVEKFQYW